MDGGCGVWIKRATYGYTSHKCQIPNRKTNYRPSSRNKSGAVLRPLPRRGLPALLRHPWRRRRPQVRAAIGRIRPAAGGGMGGAGAVLRFRPVVSVQLVIFFLILQATGAVHMRGDQDFG